MKRHSIFIILSSFFVAFVLTIIKLPVWADYLRPAWIPLLICYWVLALPHQMGITAAWFCGLLLDALNNTLLGEHALGLIIIAYFILKFHRQIRVFPVWQQACIIMLMIILYQFTLFWIQGLIGQPTGGWLFWLPAASSALFWPIIIYLLRSWQQRLYSYT